MSAPTASAPRLIVTGSRDWTDAATVRRALATALIILDGDRGQRQVTLVHGGCNLRPGPDGAPPVPAHTTPRGADAIADEFWRGLGLPVEVWWADWSTHGRAAGPRRNQAMVDAGADFSVAFSLNRSPGTEDCIDRLRAASIRTDIVDAEELDA